jgi:hypothetical protein
MTTSTHASPRGFVYALEPLRRIRESELDAALAEVARIRASIELWRRSHGALSSQLAAGAASAREEWTKAPAPIARGAHLGFLSVLQQSCNRARAHIEELEQELAGAAAEAKRRRVALEVLDAHRSESEAAWRLAVERRLQTEADEGWTLGAATRAVTQEAP